MAVLLVRDICLRQHHQVIVTKLHDLDGLIEAEAASVPDILRSEVDPCGVGAACATVAAVPCRVSCLHGGEVD